MQPIINVFSYILSLFGYLKPALESSEKIHREKIIINRSLIGMTLMQHMCVDTYAITRTYKQWWIPNYFCHHTLVKTRLRRNDIDDINIVRVIARYTVISESYFSGFWCMIPEPLRVELIVGLVRSTVDARYGAAAMLTEQYMCGVISAEEYLKVTDDPGVVYEQGRNA